MKLVYEFSTDEIKELILLAMRNANASASNVDFKITILYGDHGLQDRASLEGATVTVEGPKD